MAFFDQVSGQLADVGRQQNDLRRAVDSGELWMEAGVAEAAAERCEQTITDIDEWLTSADRLTKRRKFGANDVGDSAAERFGQAGDEIVMVMQNAQQVFANMADTYRAAGRTAAEADAAGGQMFRGSSE
jgi:ABC-type transporter Mla subunit MlaD